MNHLMLILALIFPLALFAQSPLKAPPAFAYQGSQAVFGDFLSATYQLRYDIPQRKATYQVHFKVALPRPGHLLFDARTAPQRIRLNGESVSESLLRAPDGATSFRVLEKALPAGDYELEMEGAIAGPVEWHNGGVHAAFWMSDLTDRAFLEQYLPASFEYDQLAMRFELTFVGAQREQTIYSNGVLLERSLQRQVIEFPPYFTASSLYFHTAPSGVMAEKRGEYLSVDGRVIPLLIYLKPSFAVRSEAQLEKLLQQSRATLAELEAAYGPYPHPALLVYNAGSGGMEYCGATITSERALGHEITHFFFARGAMPANGNAGWFDEAVASWRDSAYPPGGRFEGGANLAGRSPYARTTARESYAYGAQFIANLNTHLAPHGGLVPFLRALVQESRFVPYEAFELVAAMERFYGVSLQEYFQRHTLRTGSARGNKHADHEHHPKVSAQQLRDWL